MMRYTVISSTHPTVMRPSTRKMPWTTVSNRRWSAASRSRVSFVFPAQAFSLRRRPVRLPVCFPDFSVFVRCCDSTGRGDDEVGASAEVA